MSEDDLEYRMMTEVDFERLELEDQVEATGFLSPRDYAKMRSTPDSKIAPQMVYYYVRTGKLEMLRCVCGRKVVNVKEADAVFEEARSRRKNV